MKIRTGFVSNSSSSSFVILSKPDDLNKVLDSFDDVWRNWLSDLLLRNSETVSVEGKEYVVSYGEYDTGDFQRPKGEDFETCVEMIDKFFSKVKPVAKRGD